MHKLFTGFLLLTAGTSFAHIKLTEPPNINVTDMYGSPNKSEPCGGSGTATGVITPVEAGSDLTVVWHEPIFHPGHFRVGIAQARSEFVTPIPVLTNNNTRCSTAPIQSPVIAPILADGLFASHTREPDGGYVVHVRVPDMECANCTLQVMQFMSAHAPSCFYYQCAALKIWRDAGVPFDAGTGQGGGSAAGGGSATGGGTAAGGGSATGGSTAVGGGSDTGGGGSATGGGSADAGTTGGGSAASTGGGSAVTDGGTDPAEMGGCSCGVTAQSGLVGLGLALLLLKRRRIG